MKLFYLPLEPYIERYTYFLSAEDGWFANDCKRLGIPCERVAPETTAVRSIRAGAQRQADDEKQTTHDLHSYSGCR